MLKITTKDSDGQQTLILAGKLVDPWIAELRNTWGETRPAGTGRVVVDLSDVTVISQEGESLLLQMMNEGATFNCCQGVLTKHVLQSLRHKCREQGNKGGQG